ncbi:MAG: anthranilate phosphoribosyltransferase [Dichotomicrobium sp.]
MQDTAQDFKPFLQQVSDGRPLSAEQAGEAFALMMAGSVPETQIAGFLMALRARGETVDEIAGAATAMRERMKRVSAPADAIDIVGTGGDAKGTHNVSTCTAFVVAGAGVPVAKHGNRAVSSRSGAADVLEHLGVGMDVPPEDLERALSDARVGFMFAPAHHAAMRHVAPARKALGVRTIFNVLGPLCNPAGVSRLLIGVYAPEMTRPLAEVLARLGAERAWVVHGHDGLDELSTTGESMVAELKDGRVNEFTVSPEEAGLARARLSDLIGGDAAANAEAIRETLAGAPGPLRDVILLNAAAALIVAGKAETLREGAEQAAQAIDSGAGAAALEKLAAICGARANA